MNEPSLDRWAERLTLTARALPYPPTPNIAATAGLRLPERPAGTTSRRWQLAVLALALLALGLLAVPPVRAAVVQFIQIGVVRIFVGPATPTPTPTAAPTELAVSATPTSPGRPTATATPSPVPSDTPSASLLDSLAGETTLGDARARAGFTVVLPAYPSDLGLPDRVFLQTNGAPMVVLVWQDLAHSGQPRLALFEIAPGNIGIEKSEFTKGVPPSLQNTTVHGQPAAWTTGPYLFQLKDGSIDFNRLIEGHVLIWVENDITYRLELGSDSTMEDAVMIAESLR
jgi:hypothetical protein